MIDQCKNPLKDNLKHDSANALKNDVFLKVLRGEAVDRTPVWMMRQAGRYLPEYRATREKAGSFMDLCRNPELACEVTLQPLQRFDFDAAILFSDILTVPDALGQSVAFGAGIGPQFDFALREEGDLRRLSLTALEEKLAYVFEAVRVIVRALDGRAPLIGFAGSPWTLATYMVEGGSSRDFAKVKGMLYQRPDLMKKLLDLLSEAVSRYLNAQIAAGVQTVMLFDSWGGILPYWAYEDYSLASMKRVLRNLKPDAQGQNVPSIIFSKGGGAWLAAMRDSGATALGLDWTVSLAQARHICGDQVVLQGNMDPAILRSSPEAIDREVQRVLADYGQGEGHIFNLGHGITPDIDPEHVSAMVEAVRRHSPQYHQEKHQKK